MKGMGSLGALAPKTLPSETFLNPIFCLISSKFGILIPAGMPEHEKDRTSSDVKSGLRKWSFSKSLLHGSFGIMLSALSTSFPNALVLS
jgi:hypothetical protein